jgi:hypothetical protein
LAPQELDALEQDLPPEYAHFERMIIGSAIVYRGTVDLDPLPVRRRLGIICPDRPSKMSPIVMADGPRTPRHRFHAYRPSALCLWYSRDEPEMQWQLHTGLAGLIDIARVHLLREARFRQKGTWRGPEVHFDNADMPTNRALRRACDRHRRPRCWCGSGRRYIRCHGALSEDEEIAVLGLQTTEALARVQPDAA